MQCETGARVRVRHRSSTSGRRSESDTSDVYRTYLKMIRQDGYCTIHCPSSTHHLSTHLDHQHRRRCTCILPRCLKSMKGTGGVWRIDSDWVYIEWRPALKMGGAQCIHSSKSWSLISTDTYHSSISLDFQVLLPPQFRLQTTTLRWSVELNGKKYIL